MTPALFHILSRTTDADAARYCSEWGAVDRLAITYWFRGLKYQVGIWPNTVGWMLRSGQSVGTGTVVPSFGGLGTYSGTMVNGPTWGVDGVAFSDTSQSITRSGLNTPPSPMTFGVVSDKSNTSASIRSRIFGVFPKRHSVGDTAGTRRIDLRNQGNSDYLAWNPAVSTNFIAKAVSVTGNLTAAGYANGVALTPTSAGAVNGWDDAAGDSTELFGVTVANDAVIRVALIWIVSGEALTSGQHAAFSALYKSSIGQGLGLP